MNGAPHAIRHVIIRGRVQRVGFRAWIEYTALGHGLEGWVRNRRNGAVEAVFAGPAEAVNEMVEASRQGPPGAHVEGIDQRDGAARDLALRRPGDLFSMLPTA
jgi:acylphosphatase